MPSSRPVLDNPAVLMVIGAVISAVIGFVVSLFFHCRASKALKGETSKLTVQVDVLKSQNKELKESIEEIKQTGVDLILRSTKMQATLDKIAVARDNPHEVKRILTGYYNDLKLDLPSSGLVVNSPPRETPRFEDEP